MSESINQAEVVRQRVEVELNQIANLQLKDVLSGFLVHPYLQIGHGNTHRTREQLPCWIVADLRRQDLALAYSEFGHGSYGNHWGIVKLLESYFGRDDSWFLLLEDAFINSGSYKGAIPDDYEIR